MDAFEMNHDEIPRAVKNDIGLIQGRRRKPHSTQAKVTTGSEDESENSYHAKANGAGDDVTKVLKMECCVFKQDPASVTGPTEEENSAQVETDLERMFVAYCFQYDIPYVPRIPRTTKRAGGFHQQHHGKQSHENTGKTKRESPGFTASTPASFIPLPTGFGKLPMPSGGSGGGKRPPRPHIVKSIPADAHSQSETVSESDQVGHHQTSRNRDKRMADSTSTNISSFSTVAASASSVRTETDVSERDRKLSDKASKRGKPVSFDSNPQIRLIEDELLGKLPEWHTSKSIGGNKHAHHKNKHGEKQRTKSSLISTFRDIIQPLERDHEWLEYTTSEDETRDEEAEVAEGNGPPEERERPVEPDLQRFVNETKALDRLSSLLRLDPYQRLIRGNKCIQVRWNPRSGEFIGMCFHAALFFLVTASAFVSMGYIAYGIVEPASSTQQVLQVEFANHVTECLFIVFISLFLSVWSVSCVMELGIHYADFTSRVNLGICLTKYDVTEGLHAMIIKSLSITGAVAVVAVLLFFGGHTKTSAFREACGFIGFAVIRPLNFHIRESTYYPLVEILGLLIALHSLLCFNVVILQFMVYAKALENMARRFNLRLVYRLGQIYEGAPHERKMRVKKYIPFNKLYAEHRIVTSLFHQFGQVNSVILSCFMLVVSLEVMLLIWVIFQVLSLTTGLDEPDSNQVLHGVGSVTLAVPLRLKEFESELVIKAVVLFDFTVIAFVKFGGVLHKASDTLHVGMEYIRRHGLMLCRNSKERRFILTMISSYAPKAPYWIGQSFAINRSSILGFLAFLVSASMVFASFNPSRTTSQQLQQCDETGRCTVFKFQKISLDRVYQAVPPPSPGMPPPPNSHAPVSSSTTGPENQISSFIYLKTVSTPCASSGSYPYDLYEHSASCRSKWLLPSQPAVIFTPYLYRQLEFTDPTGKHNYFGEVRLQFAQYGHSSQECADLRDTPREQITFPLEKTGACVSDTFACHYFPFQSAFDNSPIGSEVVDCFNRPVSNAVMDDCRNLDITTTDSSGRRMEARPRIVYTGSFPGASDPLSLLCCYEYGGYTTGLVQARVCNMPDMAALNTMCLFGSSRDRMKGEVLELHDKILLQIQDEVENDGLDEFLLSNEEIIAGCLCRLNGTDPPKEDLLQCRGILSIPCVLGTYPRERLFTLECGPNPAPEVNTYIPILLLLKPNSTLYLPVEHQRYGSFCPGARFKDKYFHDDDLFYKDPFEPGGPQVPVTDCSGNPIVGGLTDSDDCRNWRIRTPSLDGEMKLPTVILKQNDYNSKNREFTVGVPANDSIFVCCFHYASDIFQRNPTQLTFCNAPSIRAMSHPEWCLALAQNGVRNSPTFPLGKRAYEQLSNKLKLVAKYYSIRHNGGNLLDSPVEQEKWQKCMCSDLIRDLELSEIENAVDICFKSIPTPCELLAVGMYDARTNCPVGWLHIKEMMYPKIFTIENGIWEEFAQFVIRGSPPVNCPRQNDANWETDPNLDNPNIKFSDCGLNVINSLTKDDCGIHNIPILNGKGVVTKPTKVVNLEYTLMSYNVPNPRWAAAHCCYHYSGYDDQWQVCNLPNSDSFLKKCDMSNRAPQRLAHEREFSRMAMVEDTNFGAVFKGNLVPRYDATTGESRVRKLFDDCICQNTNHPMCEAYYLPPCIAPKVALSATIQVDDTFSRCDHAWNTALPDFLRIPVIREFDKNTMQFKKLARFRDGSTPADCPNVKTTDILTNIPSGMTISDCYGDELDPTSLPLDDCGNPYIRTPKRTNVSEWEYPTIHLIPLDRMPGMTGDEVFCCFLYPISNVSEVNVCNMPDAGAVRNKCKERNQTSKTIIDAIGQFKRLLRGTGRDDILSRGLSDQGRAMWTDCICGRNESICNSLSPPCFADPAPLPAPVTQEWVDKMYFSCQVPNSWYYYEEMYYPKYFRRDARTTAFIPLKVAGLPSQNCSEFAKDAKVATGGEGEVYDCEGKMYGIRSKLKYDRDDCQNVVAPLDQYLVTRISVRYNRKRSTWYPLCCNEYPRDPESSSGRTDRTWRQSETCNTVSRTALSTACENRIKSLEYYMQPLTVQFLQVWEKSPTDQKDRMETDTTVVTCVCRHLPHIRNKSPDVKTCTEYINRYYASG